MTTLQRTPNHSPLTESHYRIIMGLPVLPQEYLPRIIPGSGSHTSRDSGICVMELAAWIAGEPHTDTPECVCPTITRILTAWNDAITDGRERQALLNHLIPTVIGTQQGDEVAMTRHYAALNRTVTYHMPVWLRVAGMHQHAHTLAQAPHVPPPDHQAHTDRLLEMTGLLYEIESEIQDNPLSTPHKRNPHYEQTDEAGTRSLVRYRNNPPEDSIGDPWTEGIDPYPEIVEILASASRMALTHMETTLQMGMEEASANIRSTSVHLQQDTARTIAQIAALGR